ncbi:hypothetical protein ACS0TY_017302 [Phlomoides rotata]
MVPQELFHNRFMEKTYTKDQLDEVRIEWAQRIQKNIVLVVTHGVRDMKYVL